MDQVNTASISWWADATAASRAALTESRAQRLEINPDPGHAAELDRREAELARLAAKFAKLRDGHRLPRPSPASVWLEILKEIHSEQVTSFTAVTVDETDAVIAELPDDIAKRLREDLDRETVVLRYDALSRSAYYVIRRKSTGLVVWIWSDLGQLAAANLLSSLVNLDGPLIEALALELAQKARQDQDP